MAQLIDPVDTSKSVSDNRDLMLHQQDAVNALNGYFDVNDPYGEQNGLLVMPTGSGKTFTSIYWLVNYCVANGYKILWLVHRQELIDQTYYEFLSQVPQLAKCGINKVRIIPVSGMHYKMSMASRGDIYICSIASVANPYGYRFIKRMLGKQGMEKLIVVVDEAHHAVNPSYQKVLKRITELNPNRILMGLTATPTRMQKNEIAKLQRMFNISLNLDRHMGNKKGYIHEVTMKNLLVSGFLANPIYNKIETHINGDVEYELSEEDEAFFNRFGEFSEELKDKIAHSAVRNKIILDEYLKNKDIYGKTLIFALNQEHAFQLNHAFNEAGISCNYVISDRNDNQEVIREFKKKDSKLMVLINVQILTEGSDVPNVQTVFLTRQTNSDSLLMQMIGRGLRGPAAGGTKVAYIVDFHDTWDKFTFWLDPQDLPLFQEKQEDGYEADDIIKEQLPLDEYSPLVDRPDILGEIEIFTEWDLYLRVYNNMKSNLISGIPVTVYPNGWYSIVDDDGHDYKILVYDSQLKGYMNIRNNIKSILKGNFSASTVIVKYFDIQVNLPQASDIKLLLSYIKENQLMPDYFTFKQRDLIDPKKIAVEMNSKFSKDEEKVMWLKEIFDKTPIVKDFYKLFYVFKKAVFSALTQKQEEIIEFLDDREEFKIVDNYYNLEELLDDIIKEYPFMNRDYLIEIGWTSEPVRRYFGICIPISTDEKDVYKFVIKVNKLLSSPAVDKDVVKYIVYHEMLHASGYWDHSMSFRKEEWKFPNSEEHDGFLDELSLRYKLDVVFDKKRRG